MIEGGSFIPEESSQQRVTTEANESIFSTPWEPDNVDCLTAATQMGFVADLGNPKIESVDEGSGD